MSAADVIDRLQGVRERGPGRWAARCPAHEDKTPSLSIRELDDGTVLLHDFGGCHALDVCRAIGLEFAALFPARRIRRVDWNERPRIPAGERLELIEHEVGVAFFTITDFVKNKTISDDDYNRLATALGRIGNARHA